MYRIEADTPIGRLALGSDGSALCYCLPADDIRDIASEPPDGICMEAAAYLSEYFSGSTRSSALPLNPAGTDFQKRIWLAAARIGYGCTATYGAVAALAGLPGACRAAGTALGANPLMIFVPCHRVIKADGTPGGFAFGNAVKKYLLDRERRMSVDNQ